MPYHTFTIPKKSGGTRTITAPDKELKAKQRDLLEILYKTSSPSNLCHGFVKGRSPMTNAQKHVGKKYIAGMDVKDFFPSCRYYGFPNSDKYSFRTIREYEEVLYHNGALPQGAPTSPHIANLYLSDFDCQAVSVLREHVSDDIVYTRYADDITVSSNSRAIEKAPEIIARMIRSHGMELNESKTRIDGSGSRQNITGYNVNAGRVTVPKSYRKKVRAMVHRATDSGWILTEKQLESLNGMISHIATAHPGEASRYREQLKGVKTVKGNPKRAIKKRVQLRSKTKFKATEIKEHGESSPTITRRIII